MRDADIAQVLPRALVNQSEDNAEGDIEQQTTADQLSRAVLASRRGMRILRMLLAGELFGRNLPADAGRHGRDARVTARATFILLVVKPDQTMVLQVVINRQNGNDGNWFVGHGRQEHDPMHRDSGPQKQILRNVQRPAHESALNLAGQPGYA